jgi:hypothetical protein
MTERKIFLGARIDCWKIEGTNEGPASDGGEWSAYLLRKVRAFCLGG